MMHVGKKKKEKENGSIHFLLILSNLKGKIKPFTDSNTSQLQNTSISNRFYDEQRKETNLQKKMSYEKMRNVFGLNMKRILV